MNTFQAVNARPGELRFADLTLDIQAGDSVAVQCLTCDGVPVQVALNVTEKWAARAWVRALQCPCCLAPAWVLAIQLDAVACGRCIRRTTLQSRRKNNERWRLEGVADELARALVGSEKSSRRRLQRRAAELARKAEEEAMSVLVAADTTVSLANRAIRGQLGLP